MHSAEKIQPQIFCVQRLVLLRVRCHLSIISVREGSSGTRLLWIIVKRRSELMLREFYPVSIFFEHRSGSIASGVETSRNISCKIMIHLNQIVQVLMEFLLIQRGFSPPYHPLASTDLLEMVRRRDVENQQSAVLGKSCLKKSIETGNLLHSVTSWRPSSVILTDLTVGRNGRNVVWVWD